MKKIYKIKKFREDSTLRALQDRRKKLATAEVLVEQKNSELVRYRQWRTKKENELFDDMRKQKVSLSDLNWYTGKALELRDNEICMAQSLESAREECRKAEQAEADARKKYVSAFKSRHKIEELHNTLLKEQNKIEERKVEAELDDIQVTKPATAMI